MALKPGCAFIIQATDNVHLQQMLRSNPLTEYSQVSVIPLVSFGESLFRQKDREEELKKKTEKQ
jgi:muconolactone delta-isomerase